MSTTETVARREGRASRRLGGLAAAMVGTVIGCLAAVAPAGAYSPPSCPPVTYHSEPSLHAQRACNNTGVTTHGTTPNTYLFATPGERGAGIFQDNGTLVWWHQAALPSEYNFQVVSFQGQNYLAAWAGGNGTGSITLFDDHYQIAGHVTAGNGFPAKDVDLHEFRITSQGYGLIGVSNPVWMSVNGHYEWVMDYVVQKISIVRDSSGIHTGQVLFQWDSLRDVPVSMSHLPDPGANGTYDYFHGNAIGQDFDGDLLVSSRNTWGIYKINDNPGTPGYGHVYWQVGAKTDNKLPTPWCYQHDIVATGAGTYTLYDDGGTGPGCSHPARAVIFSVDPSVRPVRVSQLASYSHTPSIYNRWTGGAQLLSNRDVLVDWADVPDLTEFSSSGQVNMDLSMSNWSYRAFRFPWVGLPLTPPSVAASRTSSGTAVWASWNGSTQVAGWRVLGGSSSGSLAPVSGVINKQWFETEIDLSSHPAYVAVQALDSGGRVLNTSQPVAVSG